MALATPAVLGRVLEFVDARTAARVAVCSRALRALVDGDEAFWTATRASLLREAPDRKRARRSARLRTSAKERCRHGVALRAARTEIFLLRLQKLAGGDQLSVPAFRELVADLEPLLLDRFFPVLQSSTLIELVKARGVREARINAVLRLLLSDEESSIASRNRSNAQRIPVDEAGADGMTALCIASARGLHLVVATLLAAGASQTAVGTGCFQSPSRTRIKGSFTPLGWAERMLVAIAAHKHTHAALLANLAKCKMLLQNPTAGSPPSAP